MILRLSYLNLNLALTLGYLNPALNNSVLEGKKRNWDLPFFGQEKKEVQALKVLVHCRIVLL